MAKSTVSVRIDGGDRLIALMRELPRRITKKWLKKAMVAASRDTIRDAKAAAPRRLGLLKKSIGRKVKSYRNGNVTVVIGARASVTGSLPGGGGPLQVPANYAHLVEEGTRPHAVGKGSSLRKRKQTGGQHPGARPQPFLGPAFAKNKDAAIETAKGILLDGLEKEAADLAR